MRSLPSTTRSPIPKVTRPDSRLRRRTSDVAQTAIVLVVAVTVLLMTVAALLVQQSSNTDPLLSTNTIQHYAYRALEAGLNSYQSVVNQNPNLADCSNLTNGTARCQNAQYDTWNAVYGTNSSSVTSGVVPEYYLFDNPQPTLNADGSLKVLKVQVVGVAGYPGKYVYQSSTVNFSSTNGFLDNVWWSDLESTTGTVTNPAYRSGNSLGNVCQYGWTTYSAQTGYEAGPDGASDTGNCYAVSFGTGDTLNGPIFTNDSIYITGSPVIGTAAHPAETADPYCSLVTTDRNGNYVCATDGSATVVNNQPTQTPPQDNSALQSVAGEASPNNGCIYYGPTAITLKGASGMTVTSPDTNTVASGCPLNSTGALPPNGVVFVENVPTGSSAATVQTGANPFDDTGSYWGYPSTDNGKYAQTAAKYPFCADYATPANNTSTIPCYFGSTSTPDAEGDAFVSGSLSGLLTIGTSNDIFIDGNITYSHCTTWAGTAHESACTYNGSGNDDSLGLIAYHYVEVNHPINTDDATCTPGRNAINWYSNAATCAAMGSGGSGVDSSSLNTLMPNCGANGAEPAPLCEPVNATGVGSSSSVIADAAILALSQSFGADNFGSGGQLGPLVVYGSIEQESRGAIAVEGTSGWTKYYTWDPRLEIAAPPSYLTPGLDSYSLLSSSISSVLTCPTLTKAYSAPPDNNATPACPTPPN